MIKSTIILWRMLLNDSLLTELFHALGFFKPHKKLKMDEFHLMKMKITALKPHTKSYNFFPIDVHDSKYSRVIAVMKSKKIFHFRCFINLYLMQAKYVLNTMWNTNKIELLKFFAHKIFNKPIISFIRFNIAKMCFNNSLFILWSQSSILKIKLLFVLSQ